MELMNPFHLLVYDVHLSHRYISKRFQRQILNSYRKANTGHYRCLVYTWYCCILKIQEIMCKVTNISLDIQELLSLYHLQCVVLANQDTVVSL